MHQTKSVWPSIKGSPLFYHTCLSLSVILFWKRLACVPTDTNKWRIDHVVWDDFFFNSSSESDCMKEMLKFINTFFCANEAFHGKKIYDSYNNLSLFFLKWEPINNYSFLSCLDWENWCTVVSYGYSTFFSPQILALIRDLSCYQHYMFGDTLWGSIANQH